MGWDVEVSGVIGLEIRIRVYLSCILPVFNFNDSFDKWTDREKKKDKGENILVYFGYICAVVSGG